MIRTPDLEEEDETSFRQAFVRGARERLVPSLMTARSTSSTRRR